MNKNTIVRNTSPYLPVLIVDDEEEFLLSAEFTLSSYGINNVISESDSRKVPELLKQNHFSAIILDLYMPNVTGLELLPMISREYPNTPIVILTAVNELETAVECMKNGAFDYIVKPIDDERLVTSVKRAVEFREMQTENIRLRESLLVDDLKNQDAFSEIISCEQSMHSLFKYVEVLADTSLPILITGETGTGKELFARAVHNLSGRQGSLIPVNVSGIDDTSFTDTLFGHVRGAYTGAESVRKGLVEQASNGTLMLDEIGDLSIETQVKLLRLMQEGTYYPLGSDIAKMTNARIILATHRDLDQMTSSGEFRKDLFFRLRSHHIHIPPLRKRKYDIPLLTDHFLELSSQDLEKNRPTAPKELYTLLSTYHFPGNVRELEGMVYDAVSRHDSGTLSLTSFRDKISPADDNDNLSLTNRISDEHQADFDCHFPEPLPTLKDMETLLIAEAMQRSGGNQTIAAQILGLSRRALNNRLRRDS